jgi:hypothetical protein
MPRPARLHSVAPDAPDAPGTAADEADSPAARASRILPRIGEDGRAVEIDPPAGGSWLRDPDGGLRPADETTAAGAGLTAPGK